jgi:hypothetical protein
MNSQSVDATEVLQTLRGIQDACGWTDERLIQAVGRATAALLGVYADGDAEGLRELVAWYEQWLESDIAEGQAKLRAAGGQS